VLPFITDVIPAVGSVFELIRPATLALVTGGRPALP
jgi:predicted PurR-regulated permease PerM